MNIRRIAELAGVSVATISRVLNHPELVSPETRERVYAVMQESQYTPNWFARNLTQKQTRTIALLYPSNESTFLQDVATGVETVALNKNNMVFFCHTKSAASLEKEYLRQMLERNVDGIIVYSANLSEELAGLIANQKTPCVFIGNSAASRERNNCYINFMDAAARMTEHILRMNYESVDLLLDNLLVNESEEIKKGFELAVSKYGRQTKTNCYIADRTVQGGMLFAQRMIQTGTLPRALITVSSKQAFGVLKAAKLAGVKVPEKLAIASMSDSAVASLVEPPLTAVDRPGKRLGMVAARMLFDCIENREFTVETPQHIELIAKLAIRKSCGNTKFIYELFE